MIQSGEQPPEGERVNQHAQASDSARIYQAGRDQHFYYQNGVRRRRRVESGIVDRCPYPGLAVFEPGQAQWFFGRDELIAKLTGCLDDHLREGGPLAVVGPSGAGKSSLLNAGLLPALEDGVLPGSRQWPRMLFTPTVHPLATLASHLATNLGVELDSVAEALAGEPQECMAILRGALRTRVGDGGETGLRLVVVIDQLEELFTLCESKPERRRFVDLVSCLAAVGPCGEPPVGLVVYGLRADFYAQCADYPQLQAVLQNAQVLVGPMSPDQLREAILFPALDVGLEIEPGLVELLLADLGVAEDKDRYEAGKLPLLAHALRATWQQRNGHTLTVDGYQKTRGICYAVADTADRIFNQLNPAEREASRILFLRLIKIGDGVEDTRRRMARESLLDISIDSIDPDTVGAVVDAFTRGRLLTQEKDTVEITHEALLSAWPRLRMWIDTDKAENLIRQDLEEAAAVWGRNRRDTTNLHRGSRLKEARAWAAGTSHGDDLTPHAKAFLLASTRYEYRATQVRRAVIALLSVLSLLISGVAVFAFRQRDTAISQQLVAEANSLRASQPKVSLLLSIKAFHTARTAEAKAEARSSLLSAQANYYTARISTGRGATNAVLFNADGRLLASADQNNSVSLWDITSPSHPSACTLHTNSPVYDIALSPDGTVLAAAGQDGTISLWDLPHRGLSTTFTGHISAVNDVAVSPDGYTLASASDDGTIKLWDVSRRALITTLRDQDHVGPVNAVAFSPDGRTVAGAYADTTVTLWDIDSQAPSIPLIGHTRPVRAMAFSPDGHALATGGGDASVKFWNLDSRTMSASLIGHTGPVRAVAFSPDGHTLATGGEDASTKGVMLWDTASHTLLTSLAGPTKPVSGLAFSPDSSTLASASADSTMELWDVAGPVHSNRPVLVNAVAVGPRSSDLLATSGADGLIRLWQVTPHRRQYRVIDNDAQTIPTADYPNGPTVTFGMAFSPDGRLLAAPAKADAVELWDMSSSTPTSVTTLTGHLRPVNAVAFSPDGRILASASADNTVKLWDVASTGQAHLYRTLNEIHFGSVNAVAFDPIDDHILATGSDDGTVNLTDLSFPDPPQSLDDSSGRLGPVEAVTFSSDGRILASASTDSTIRIWDVATRQQIQTLTGHEQAVVSVAFNSDGTLASASNDGVIKLWTTPSGKMEDYKLWATLTDRVGATSVAFTPDGRLASADQDGKSVLWDIVEQKVIDRVCAEHPTLTEDQWKQYIPGEDYGQICPD